ncbi:amidohydrolase family protein [Terrilactibacillus sp. S3-3]|nr:amidohydrolase family protein [Terrilactibacillus sp. S3-3]
MTTRIFFSPALNGDLEKIKTLQASCHSRNLALSGLKQFVDGVVTSHTAYLLMPYLDCPDTRGHSNQSAETFKKWIVEADREGLQVRLHAIGNAAVRLALDAFEAAQKVNGKRDSRHVIEHVEVLHPDDRLRFFKQLGVIASFQPWHIGLLKSEAYTSRIGKEQHPCFYPIKKHWPIPEQKLRSARTFRLLASTP